jgi:hypothetical protein
MFGFSEGEELRIFTCNGKQFVIGQNFAATVALPTHERNTAAVMIFEHGD